MLIMCYEFHILFDAEYVSSTFFGWNFISICCNFIIKYTSFLVYTASLLNLVISFSLCAPLLLYWLTSVLTIKKLYCFCTHTTLSCHQVFLYLSLCVVVPLFSLISLLVFLRTVEGGGRTGGGEIKMSKKNLRKIVCWNFLGLGFDCWNFLEFVFSQ